jgi:hypothetical protein
VGTLFPSLCVPTGQAPTRSAARPDRCGERTAMMPTRTRTRRQNRANRIAAERRHNRRSRELAEATHATADHTQTPPCDADEPPPF